jgi:protein gp37
MGKESEIQWTDHTWNVARGCTKVNSDCKFCYMMRQSEGIFKFDGKTVTKTKTVFNLPLKIKEPSKIFTSSLTDFFHPDIDSFRHEAYEIMRKCPQHTFQVLTKRPERIDIPDDLNNIVIGASVGHQKASHIADTLLKHAPKRLKTFLSIEPLHAPVMLDFSKFDWVIVGGESGNETGFYRYRECKLEWIQDIVDTCKAAGTPVFVKQLGTFLSKQLKHKDRHGGDIEEFPESLKVREFPK